MTDRVPWRLLSGRRSALGAALVSLALLAHNVAAVLAGFQPFVQFGAGTGTFAVAAADLNGDGKVDLAVANFNSSSVTVLLSTTPTGASVPTFAAPVAFSAGATPSSVAAPDLNDDGRPDLVVANRSGNDVSVLLNTTAPGAIVPTFTPQVTFGTGAQPVSVTAADLNGDGKPDLAVANQTGLSVGVLLNTTPAGAMVPTFGAHVPFALGFVPFSVTAADVNGDGRPDLVAPTPSDFSVQVLPNTTSTGVGVPTFASPVAFAAGVTSDTVFVAAADVNGDGRPDLAVANDFEDTLSVLLNTTPTGVSAPAFSGRVAFPAGAKPVSVAAGDINGDGRPDFVVANQDGNNVSVLLNTTPPGASVPTFATQVTLSTGGGNPISVAAGDVNGDGKPDLATANLSGDSASVLLANPSGSLQFSGATTVVGEGAGAATITLSRSGSVDGQISALVSLTGGTATAGQDFTLAGPQTVTWADNDGADKTVVIPITQDQIDEGDEQLQLTLSLPTNPFGATLGAQTTAAVTITDDDPVALNVANVSVTEGNNGATTATFTVTRTGATVRTATVQYATADGSAKAGTDYAATSGALTFAPNEPTRTIAVPVIGDTVFEPDESFTLTLSNPTNATLGVAQAVGTIVNDDVVVACTPRPRVTQTLQAGGGALNVRIESTPLNTPANNPLQQIRFGAFQNATVTLNEQPVTSGQSVTLPASTFGADLVVQRVTAGQPTTVPFTVVDGCGEWTTFVGGGPAAGF